MVKFTNFCGIFATTFMVATAITIASCSQDDDYYDSNMYTLAEKMETRSGGDPGGEVPHQLREGLPVYAGDTIIHDVQIGNFFADLYISWTRGFTGMRTPRSGVNVIYNFRDYTYEGSTISLGYNTASWEEDKTVKGTLYYTVEGWIEEYPYIAHCVYRLNEELIVRIDSTLYTQ